MATVLVTGGTGFIGAALLARLAAESQWQLRASVRAGKSVVTPDVSVVEVPDISADTNWQQALEGVDVVVHTAAVAHVRNVHSGARLAWLRSTNVDGTLNLGHQALAAGVRRFVFVSSIGVNGNRADLQPFDENTPPDPQAAYAVSKLDAEVGLRAIFEGTDVELVIIRPPLIYAAHAHGNFHRLLQVVELGIPLPFAGVNNRRNLVALDNVVDFIRCCMSHPAAVNELFLLAEGQSISTAQIIRYLAQGMGKRARLFRFPLSWIRLGCRAVGLGTVYVQLLESLTIDGGKAQRLLGWKPVVDTEAGMVAAGKAYWQQRHGGRK